LKTHSEKKKLDVLRFSTGFAISETLITNASALKISPDLRHLSATFLLVTDILRALSEKSRITERVPVFPLMDTGAD
jgi:hypothetical protein